MSRNWIPISRRSFVQSLSALAMCPSASKAKGRKISMGAIRWDAWYSDTNSVGTAVKRSLQPTEFHDRVPFFWKSVENNSRFEINADLMSTLKSEIGYASKANIDYWAFDTYAPDDPMSLPLETFLKVRTAGDLKVCLVAAAGGLARPDIIGRDIRVMSNPGQFCVLNDRPLYFLGFFHKETISGLGGIDVVRKKLEAISTEVKKQSGRKPYIVIMDFDAKRAKELAIELNVDAIASYAYSGGRLKGTYEQLTYDTIKGWKSFADTGFPFVPTAMTGWNRQPRIKNPMPWEKLATDNNGPDKYYMSGTPQQIADHVEKCKDWITLNPKVCVANVGLIYAWNENDEGGWIIPTRERNGTVDTTRVEALGRSK